MWVPTLTDRSGLQAALDAALRPGESVSLVANVAGVYPPSISDYTESLYRHVFDVNVLGVLNVISAAVPHMEAGSSIVNFASVDAFAVSPGQLLYGASKAAVVMSTRSSHSNSRHAASASTAWRRAGSTRQATAKSPVALMNDCKAGLRSRWAFDQPRNQQNCDAANVRFGSIADITPAPAEVRFVPLADVHPVKSQPVSSRRNKEGWIGLPWVQDSARTDSGRQFDLRQPGTSLTRSSLRAAKLLAELSSA